VNLDLPAAFTTNIRRYNPSNGEAWLKQLPALLAESASRWELTLGDPFDLSFNYVCEASRRDGLPVVLKVGIPNRELTSEINTLRVYDGQGACRLLEADADKGMLLLEHLHPGTMLVTLMDDDHATGIAADVMKKIHRPVPEQRDFISLKGWFDELKNVRTLFCGGTGPFPEKTFAIAEGLVHDLFAENRSQMLLHGDFHHFNILSSGRGWLVIDPKGVTGPAEYEVGPLLINPYNQFLEETEAIHRTQRRIAILSERLGFDPQRLRVWAICHSVLSSYWDMDATGNGGESARAWAEVFIKTRV
jgi:streptomycin 6-kinase